MILVNYRLILLITLSIFIPFYCISQNDSIQIIENENNLISPPNIVLENSFHNKKSDSLGYHLFAINFTPCTNDQIAEPIIDRISHYEIINDSIHEIEVNFRETCCVSFKTEIEILNDSTINLKYQTYGGECLCYCCYSLKYLIQAKEKTKFKSFQLNGKTIVESEPQYFPIKEIIQYFEGTQIKEIEYFDYGNNSVKVYYNKIGMIIKKEFFDKKGKLIRISTF